MDHQALHTLTQETRETKQSVASLTTNPGPTPQLKKEKQQSTTKAQTQTNTSKTIINKTILQSTGKSQNKLVFLRQ